MSNVKIKKSKIKDDLFLQVEYTEDLPGHSKKDTKLTCTIPIHEDLKTKFQLLHRHLAVLCDQVKTPKRADFETSEFEGFTVIGFAISGVEENEGVTIIGSKEGKYGEVLLNTPFTKWDDSEYPFRSELASDIQDCVYEVEQYLFEGKRAPEQQLEMEFGADADAQDDSPLG